MIKKVEPPSIRPKLAMLKRLIAVAFLALAAAHPAAALDAVSIQLKWKHQFQFAGYYQALKQGFYRDAGLHTIRGQCVRNLDASRTPSELPLTNSPKAQGRIHKAG